ncbi:MAG: phosphate signaling complex protein PhoU [Butyrivibrio sp.]|nr:phosphate signaling complex protein PhoU [Butyrivibrio sp.]
MTRYLFDSELEELNNEMIEMGSLIEKAIEAAIQALIRQDTEIAEKTIRDDEIVDSQERKIEALCLKLLMQQQPVARDLRTISSALKMITDMERVGDHASDISEIILMMDGKPYIKDLEHIKSMAKETTFMLNNSIDAFVHKDQMLAAEVITHDDVVDELYCNVKKELISLIHQNPDNGEQAMDLMSIAKYFERIGDHATNIAEWVIFSITGKHVSEEVHEEEQTDHDEARMKYAEGVDHSD